MNTLFSRLATLVLALTLAAGLGGCRSSNETMSEGMDDEDTMDAEAPATETSGQVSTRSTLDLLEQGLTNIAVDRAVQNINGWEDRLSEADASGFSGLIDNLGALEEELESGSINASNVAQLFDDLGTQTVEAASTASGRAAENVRELGEALRTTSRALR